MSLFPGIFLFWNRDFRRFVIASTLVLVFASCAASADVNPPLPPTAEAAVIAACGGRVTRSGDTLRLTINSTSPVKLKNNVAAGRDTLVYELSECADNLGLFLILMHHYESTTQMLVDRSDGARFLVAGPIHVSPSKRAFVVVEPFGSTGEFWDYGINVFHRLPNGSWNETWQYRPSDFQGREFLSWDGENAVRISTATWKSGPLVTGHETVLRVSPLQFLREDGPEKILRDEKGRHVDHIPGEQ